MYYPLDGAEEALFSDKTLEFLFLNHLNDSRAWFHEHKAWYRRDVLRPLQYLVAGLAPVMQQIDSQLTTVPQVDKTICRIWRDTRYSHDKSLYRDSMWVIFKQGKMHGASRPGLYVEISSRGVEYGCGFYHASAAYMGALRRRVLAGAPAFEAARVAFEAQSVFHMEGDVFKRPHFPGQPDNLRLWLERRNISFDAAISDFSLIYSQGLIPKLAQDFERLGPIYHLLLETALELAP